MTGRRKDPAGQAEAHSATLTGTTLTVDEQAAARRYCERHARDADDLSLLLDALGLNPAA